MLANGCYVHLEPEDLGRNPSGKRSSVWFVPEAYVYILRCGDDSLYTGWTVDLKKRVATHNAGKGGRYTRGRLPVKVFASLKLDDKSAARREEARVKALRRPEKLALAKSWPDPAEPV